MRNSIIYIAVFLLLITTSYAQTPQEEISIIQKAFQELDYETAKMKAEMVLQYWQQCSINELLEVHKILGIITFSEGKFNESQTHFEHVLSLDQTTELDSVFISPKIISFFKKIKADFKTLPQPSPSTQFRYILIPDQRPKAFLRSLVLPGWGQIYKGQKKKGILLVSASGVSCFAWVALYIFQEKAHDRYLAATEPNDIEAKYRNYNRLYKGQHICAYFIGALWLYGLTDALISKPAASNILSSVLIYPQITNQFVCLSITCRF